MSDNSNIEWTDATWSPMRGLHQGQPRVQALLRRDVRRGLPGRARPPVRAGLRPAPSASLRSNCRCGGAPPRRVFVNCDDATSSTRTSRRRVHPRASSSVMRRAPQHTFQVLTKRAERMRASSRAVARRWCGRTSGWAWSVERRVELRACRDRRSAPRPAGVRFLSIEPMLERSGAASISPPDGIHWVIVGGESGPGAAADGPRAGCGHSVTSAPRPASRSSSSSGGECARGRTGRELDGRTWDELPRHGSPRSEQAAGAMLLAVVSP